MRHLHQLRQSPASVLIPAACVLLAVLRAASQPLGIAIDRSPVMWYGTPPVGLARANILARLEHTPGRHLVIVKYRSGSRLDRRLGL